VGTGFDLHPFAEGRKLILGGVEFPGARGLAGHSDADVLSHAAADALLGAAALGDLGQHFPASEARWKGSSSLLFLQHIRGMLEERGWRLVNLDCVVIAEEPKLLPRVAEIRARLAGVLGVAVDCISVKGKTCEGLGAVGRREGIAAQAVALLERG
jgi:2-C-methyl-D-erythritol 2,4-cyclodiphosphate synthase